MKRTLIAIAVFVTCVAATQWAMRGVHGPTGNAGYLGTELAGVEAIGAGGEAGAVGLRATAPTGLAIHATGHLGIEANGTSRGLTASASNGIAIDAIGTPSGIYGYSNGTGPLAVGVHGAGGTIGVLGANATGFGVKGTTSSGTAIFGVLDAGGSGHAGWFEGRVHVNGTLSKSAGSFRIDHPLEPATKYLSHSFVESPDMKNIYDGVVTLGDDGSAVVELPEWFDALNKDFRYQLTCIGEPAVVYIAEKIKDNRFRIAGGYAGMEVSWQVTGTRDDEYARAYPIAIEETKPPHEAGRFLHPELYRQPLTQRIVPAVRQ